MAPQIDAMLVSPDTMTKGGGPHVFSFFSYVRLSLSYDPRREGHPFKVKGLSYSNLDSPGLT